MELKSASSLSVPFQTPLAMTFCLSTGTPACAHSQIVRTMRSVETHALRGQHDPIRAAGGIPTSTQHNTRVYLSATSERPSSRPRCLTSRRQSQTASSPISTWPSRLPCCRRRGNPAGHNTHTQSIRVICCAGTHAPGDGSTRALALRCSMEAEEAWVQVREKSGEM